MSDESLRTEDEMAKFVKVAKISEIPDQKGTCVEVEGKSIAVFNLGGEFYAIDDTCTHQGGPLSDGAVDGEEVECPWHGARFKVKTGEVAGPPAFEGVKHYAVRIDGGDIEIEV